MSPSHSTHARRVSFIIDVSSDNPISAAQAGWRYLTNPDAMLPVAEVIDLETGDIETHDLQTIADES